MVRISKKHYNKIHSEISKLINDVDLLNVSDYRITQNKKSKQFYTQFKIDKHYYNFNNLCSFTTKDTAFRGLHIQVVDKLEWNFFLNVGIYYTPPIK